MWRIDRDEVLARTDLARLATEVCGEPVGRGHGTKWHCPNPDHPDRHPSMSIYRGRRGHPRWKCHSCGEGGTAIDLVMITSRLRAGDALRQLASELGMHAADPIPSRSGHPSTAVPAPAAAQPRQPSPAVERLVDQAADLLWRPVGHGARRHLHARGLTDPILRANRIGFDPGPRHLPRPKGLPCRGPGIVYPALHPTGQAIYYQLRYLDPRTAAVRKYDQPDSSLATNPRLAAIRLPQPVSASVVVVCEGFPDALSVVHVGLPAVAVLGVSHAGAHTAATLARRLLDEHPAGLYLVAFDTDQPGAVAATRLAAHLAHAGAAAARVAPPAPHQDLNACWQADPEHLSSHLTGSLATLAGSAGSVLALPTGETTGLTSTAVAREPTDEMTPAVAGRTVPPAITLQG